MGLLKCPDCGKEFSDRIDACPNCACPKSAVLEELEAKKEQGVMEQPKETPLHICISNPEDQPSKKYGNLHITSEDVTYRPTVDTSNKNTELERTYALAKSTMESAQTEYAYKGAANTFLSIKGYKDSDDLAKICNEKAEEKRLKRERNVTSYNESFQKKKIQTIEKHHNAKSTEFSKDFKIYLWVLLVISVVVALVGWKHKSMLELFIRGAVIAALFTGVPILWKLGKKKKAESINSGKVYYGLLYFRVFLFYVAGVICGEMLLMFFLGNAIKGTTALLLTLIAGIPFAVLFTFLYRKTFIQKYLNN